jgi:signal transduction histidine kinase
MLILSTVFHYFTPQMRLLPLGQLPLTRHTVERIIFILPIAGAALAFGRAGGLVTLAIAVCAMLPRVFLMSASPPDALVETLGVALVGYFVTWLIEVQEREKRLRHEAASRMEAINAIYALVTRSLERGQILNDALDMVREVMQVDAAWVYRLDEKAQELVFEAHCGLSGEFTAAVGRLELLEGFNGQVARSGEPLFVDNASEIPGPTQAVIQREGLQALFIVPLRSGDRVLGTLGVAMHGPRQFLPEEINLLGVIGNQIGVAIENARLYENMRFYARQILRAQEDERKRIARELHDDTAQMLVALSRRLDALTPALGPLPDPTRQRLEQLRELTANTLQGVRHFSQGLRPPVLDDLGLLPALEGLKVDLEEEGIEVALQVYGHKRRLSSEVELVLFRAIQEALNNVRRHSQASRVVVEVEFGDSRIKITVEDDGQGFEVPDRMVDLIATGKLGLIGMHERARLLDGTLTIRSQPGRGTIVIVDVPTQPVPKEASSST